MQQDQNIVRSSLSHTIVYQAIRKRQAFQDPHGNVPSGIRFVVRKGGEGASWGGEGEALQGAHGRAIGSGRRFALSGT